EWIEGVAGFLDEKYPLLEKLEEEHVSLLKERFDMLNQRRLSDDEDDLTIIFGPIPIPLEQGVTETNKQERREARERRRTARSKKTQEEEGYSTDSDLATHDQDAYVSAIKSLKTRTKDVLADVKAVEFIDPAKGRWGSWRSKYTESYVGAWGGLGVVSVWEFWVRLESIGWDCIE
ncbi:hypothetical protein H0H93_001516, partial [Arthromyces matolae]